MTRSAKTSLFGNSPAAPQKRHFCSSALKNFTFGEKVTPWQRRSKNATFRHCPRGAPKTLLFGHSPAAPARRHCLATAPKNKSSFLATRRRRLKNISFWQYPSKTSLLGSSALKNVTFWREDDPLAAPLQKRHFVALPPRGPKNATFWQCPRGAPKT